MLFIIPLAEQVEPSQTNLIETKVVHFQIGVQDTAAKEIVESELAGRLPGELQDGDVEDVEDVAQLYLVQIEEERVCRIFGNRALDG